MKIFKTIPTGYKSASRQIRKCYRLCARSASPSATHTKAGCEPTYVHVFATKSLSGCK
jgi:hypothetical protein